MNKRKPNFFLIGAPKSGTTSLAYYLNQHDNVFFSNPKEPNFFATDYPGIRWTKSIDDYLKLFRKANDKHTCIGEGTAFYIYSEIAMKKIFEFNPNAKIILMIRNPVDRVYSMHQQYIHTLIEDEVDFKKAWNLQDTRLEGKSIPKLCREPKMLQYGEVGKLSNKIRIMYSIFPKENIKVILFDDFVKNTEASYFEVLKFLDLPNQQIDYYEKRNPSRQFRSKFISFVIRSTPFFIHDILFKMRMFPIIKFIPIYLNLLLKKPYKQPRIDPSFRKFLKNYFEKDINDMSKLIDKKLDSWLRF